MTLTPEEKTLLEAEKDRKSWDSVSAVWNLYFSCLMADWTYEEAAKAESRNVQS